MLRRPELSKEAAVFEDVEITFYQVQNLYLKKKPDDGNEALVPQYGTSPAYTAYCFLNFKADKSAHVGVHQEVSHLNASGIV